MNKLLSTHCREVLTQFSEETIRDHLTQNAVPNEFTAAFFANLANTQWANTAVNRKLCYKALSAGSNLELDETVQQQRARFLTAVAKAGLLKHSDLSSPLIETALEQGDLELVKAVLAHVEITWDNHYLNLFCDKGTPEMVELLLAKIKSHSNRWFNLMHGIRQGAYLKQTLLEQEVEGKTPLQLACLRGDVTIVNLLIEFMPRGQINLEGSPKSSSPLEIACKQGNTDIAELLLAKGAATGGHEQYHNPFYVAYTNGHVELAKLLLPHLDAIDASEASDLLSYACADNDHEFIDLFLENLPLDQINGKHLSIACEGDHRDTVRVLLKRGANVNGKPNEPLSPLSIACSEGYQELAQELINAGASVDGRDDEKSSPLREAAANRDLALVDTLLAKKALIDGRESLGSPLARVACTGDIEMVKALLDRGANVNGKENDPMSPLAAACDDDHRDIIELLIERGAAINGLEGQGFDPLAIAGFKNSPSLIEYLLNQGANVDGGNRGKINGEGAPMDTPLMRATFKGHHQVMEILISHRANIELGSGVEGTRPLIVACVVGNKDTVLLLLEKGAAINLAEDTVMTPLLAACRRGAQDICALLLERGAKTDQLADIPWPMEGFIRLHHGNYAMNDLSYAQQRDLLAASTRFTDKKHFDALLLQNIDVNATDEDGRSVLHEVYLRGELEKAQWLLQAGANTNLIDYKGYTPENLYQYFRFNQNCSIDQTTLSYMDSSVANAPVAPAHANRNVLLELTKQVEGAAQYATGLTKMFTHIDSNTPYVGTPHDPIDRHIWYKGLDNEFKLIALELPKKRPEVQANVLRELHEASPFCGGAWKDEARGQRQVVSGNTDQMIGEKDPKIKLCHILADRKQQILLQLVSDYTQNQQFDERHMHLYLERKFGPKLGIPGTATPVDDVYEPEAFKMLLTWDILSVINDFCKYYNPADVAVWLEESLPARMTIRAIGETFGPYLEEWVSTHLEEVAAIVGTDLATFKKDLAEDLNWVANHCFKSLQSPKNPGSLSFLGVQLLLLATEVVEQNQRVEVVVGETQVELDLRDS